MTHMCSCILSLLASVSLYTCSSYLTGICYFSVVCLWSLTLTTCFTHTIHFSLSEKQIFLSSGKCKAFKCKAHYDFASSCDISQTQRILVLLSSSTDVTKFYSCWKGNIVSNSFCHSWSLKTGLWLIENREISGKFFVWWVATLFSRS